MSWKMSRKMAFLSLENGFYASGLAFLALFLFQARSGALYGDFALLLGLLAGGASLGALLGGRSSFARKALKGVSPLLPPLIAALAFLSWEAAFPALLATLILGGASTGAAYAEFNSKADSPHSPGFLWSAELLGGFCGLLLLCFFLLPAGGFLVCALALAALRLPLLFGK
jgi:hypothetical protein